MEHAELRACPVGLSCPSGSRDLLLGGIRARGLERGFCPDNQSPLYLHGASRSETSRQKVTPRAEPSKRPWNKSAPQ